MTRINSESSTNITIGGDDLFHEASVHRNLRQSVILVTEDRLRLCLASRLERLASRRDWLAPLSLLLTIVLTFVTTNFRDALGLTKDVWTAVFLIGGVATFVWLIIALLALRGRATLDDLIGEVKKGAKEQVGSEHDQA